MEPTLTTIERAAHLIGNQVEEALREFGLTQGEAHVLGRLAREGPTPIGVLQREFARKRSTLTGLLDRLEHRGFVRREINPADRRSFVIYLAAAGKRTAAEVCTVLDALEAKLGASVTDRDLQGVAAVTDALAAIAAERSGPAGRRPA